MTMKSTRRSIINWAGSKSAIADKLVKRMPDEFHAYFEPFAGGLSMLQTLNLCGKDVYVNDMNPQLMIVYDTVKKDPEALIRFAAKLESELSLENTKSYEDGKRYFLNIRDKYNAAVSRSSIRKNNVKIAGMFIFLVQLSFACLIRINQKGQYNTGYRSKSSGARIVVRSDEIHNLHRTLTCNKTFLTNVDFEDCLKNTKNGDFVYLDPPYWSETAILKYTAKTFAKDDHIRLVRVVDELTDKGCFVMISYEDHPWIRKLYKNYNVEIIDVCRCAHRKTSQDVKELIITNYTK
jgi:DNA adenine methylase